MSRNSIIAIIIIVLVLAAGAALVKRNNTQSVATTDTTPTPTASSTPNTATSTTPGTTTSESPSASAFVVTYTSSGFTPSTLTVPSGTTVQFVNGSSNSMWVASDPHPTHTDYPGFDAKKSYTSGETYSFTFTKTGSWGFHNHLNPSDTGRIIVQ